MGSIRSIFMRNTLDVNENIEVLFAYFNFRSEITVYEEGEIWETSQVYKPDYYVVSVELCREGQYLPIPPLGFVPNVRIEFTISHYSEEEIDEFIRDTLSLVQDKAWDMILVWGDADLLLGCEQGTLYLNSNFDLEWMQERVDPLNIPYTVKDIPRF